jgi:hypothetical protein
MQQISVQKRRLDTLCASSAGFERHLLEIAKFMSRINEDMKNDAERFPNIFSRLTTAQEARLRQHGKQRLLSLICRSLRHAAFVEDQ